jgi:DNA-binding FadR family transcriptional regulator
VVDGTRQKILAGTYRAGQKLPTEPQLQEEWGVSRSVIREAMKILTSQGLVRVEQGRGSFVNEANHASLRQQLEFALLRQTAGKKGASSEASELDDWDALLDLRFVLEIGAAQRAAHAASSEELETMRHTIENLRRHPADAIACGRDDFEFHSTLSVATRNPLWPAITGGLHDLLQRYLEISHHGEETGLSTANEHEAIWQAIRDGQGEAAGEAMRHHLQSSVRDLALARDKEKLKPLEN